MPTCQKRVGGRGPRKDARHSCLGKPPEGALDHSQGWRERRRRGRNPCRRGRAALSWLSLLRSGLRPPSAPAPGNGIPFRALACLRRPSRGSARRFAARSTPGYAPTPRGLSLGRNAASLHGGSALPDFTKSPCFPKWRFYRPSWGT
jgi:hypothetical protein